MTVTPAPGGYTTPTPTPPTPVYQRTGLWVVLAFAAVVVIVLILWAAGTFSTQPRIALVTASQGPYWDLIVKGAQDAADRHGVRLEVVAGPTDEPSQTRSIQGLIDGDYDGIAVSPNDPIRQARVLADLAAQTNLLTFDADTPISRRLCFVGTDNYDAGRMAGQRVREALPDGGKVILAIGSVEKENGHRRRQGVIDELLERSFEHNRPSDPLDAPIKGSKYVVAATLVDNLNPQRARELAAEALKQHPDVGCFVGLFASNTPAVLQALRDANKLGQVKVVGFDANEETVQGIKQGHVHASIVQDAYNIGYQAVRILADAAQGDPRAIPLYPTFYLRCDAWTQDNLEAMQAALTSRHKPPDGSVNPASELPATQDATTQQAAESASEGP